MPILAAFPLIIIGIIIAIVRKSAEQNRRQAAQHQAAQESGPQTASEGQAQYTPVRPSVQTAPVRKETGTWMEGTPPKGQPMHQDHDNCALKKEDPNAGNKHPDHDLCALEPETAAQQPAANAAGSAGKGVDLRFTPDSILNGVILSEILGKPKALR